MILIGFIHAHWHHFRSSTRTREGEAEHRQNMLRGMGVKTAYKLVRIIHIIWRRVCATFILWVLECAAHSVGECVCLRSGAAVHSKNVEIHYCNNIIIMGIVLHWRCGGALLAFSVHAGSFVYTVFYA